MACRRGILSIRLLKLVVRGGGFRERVGDHAATGEKLIERRLQAPLILLPQTGRLRRIL